MCRRKGFVSVLGDGRLCLRRDEVAASLGEELAHVASVGDYAWAREARVVSYQRSWRAVRSGTSRAACPAGGSFTRSVLMLLPRAPWSLALGDIDASLASLGRQALAPRDETAATMQKLLRLTHNREMLRSSLERARDFRRSTTVVGHWHGSCAAIARRHPEHSAPRLVERALARQLRALVSAGGAEVAKANARLAKRARSPARRRPQRARGRQLFFRDTVRVVRRRLQLAGRGLTSRLKRHVGKAHGAACRTFPPERVAACEHGALRVADALRRRSRIASPTSTRT